MSFLNPQLLPLAAPSSAQAPARTCSATRLSEAEIDAFTDIALSFEDWAIRYKPAACGGSIYTAEHAATGRRITAKTLLDFHRKLDAATRIGEVPPPSTRIRPFLIAHEDQRAPSEARYAAELAALDQQAEQDDLAERWMAVAR
ncbi:hypothetical protein CDO52_00620 [Nocardiopsis gilva YIM 90087]|uniref:Uncharacterized protein n=1 Tax=Nocardiopsis gilva YIM 90087 TaxID=1235441 RepID=A0A223S028_9ACTN|nr:hypothetical protein [Nocardiopsis gilva]ASU81482.1 hypothetical protein CDO52_00620 [Nocardiopsis gilva YIM 90087]